MPSSPRLLAASSHETALLPTLFALLIAAGIGGCSFAPASQTPARVEAIPERFAAAETLATYAPLRWWTAFEDPVLTQLLDTTLADNLDIAEATARVERAAALARVSASGLYPSVTATGSASFQSFDVNSAAFGAQGGGAGGPGQGGAGQGGGMGGGVGGGGQGGGQAGEAPSRLEVEQYSAGLGLAYELDFWGRVRNDARAAYADAAAAAADLQTARLSVLGGAIQTYFEVVDLRYRIALTLETIDLLAERAALTEQRYERGVTTSFELYRIVQDYRNAQAQLPSLEAEHADAVNRLAVLAGRYAGRLGDLLPLDLSPTLPLEPVPPSLPAALLIQRPDVRAAAYRFEGARYRVGARRAELLPSVSLGGNLGVQALTPGGLVDLDNWVASLTGSLSAPLFQGGRLRANASAAEAAYAAEAAVYARTVLTAFSEAETAIERYEEERQRYLFLDSQLEEAEAQERAQERRYLRGLADLTAVLDAQRNRLSVLTNLSLSGRAVAGARLGIYRALGGTWAEATPPPTLRLTDAPVPLGE